MYFRFRNGWQRFYLLSYRFFSRRQLSLNLCKEISIKMQLSIQVRFGHGPLAQQLMAQHLLPTFYWLPLKIAICFFTPFFAGTFFEGWRQLIKVFVCVKILGRQDTSKLGVAKSRLIKHHWNKLCPSGEHTRNHFAEKLTRLTKFLFLNAP